MSRPEHAARWDVRLSRAARPALLSPAARQAAFLLGTEGVVGVADYAFHLYLGQTLTPGDFAVVQAVNAVLLIVLTALMSLQPVVARFVAEAPTPADAGAVFRFYFGRGAVLGLVVVAAAWLLRRPAGEGLNVPAAAVALTGIMAGLGVVRPVVAGLLQGRRRFFAYGLTRVVFAVGRLALALLLIGLLGGTAVTGVAIYPLSGALALGVGLLFLGRGVWARGAALAAGKARQGWRLSVGTLAALAVFMTLLSADLLWVNRSFGPDEAGLYAGAVVLRRVLAAWPGVVTVLLFPRLVACISRGDRPDGLLLVAATAVLVVNTAITLLYAAFGPALLRVTLGDGYAPAAPWLVVMALGMLGYGLASIWLNVSLATRPAPFVLLGLAVGGASAGAFSIWVATPAMAALVFLVAGWSLAAGGAALYWLYTRPRISRLVEAEA